MIAKSGLSPPVGAFLYLLFHQELDILMVPKLNFLMVQTF